MTTEQTTPNGPSLESAPSATLDPNGMAPDVTRYVIVEVNSSNYGFPTGSTVELMASSAAAVTRVPKSPRFVHGVINHRGSIIPVVDTRALLGLKTASEQGEAVVKRIGEYELELLAWVDAIETAISSGEQFEGTTNAGETTLGKWRHSVLNDPRELQRLQQYDSGIREQVESTAVPHKRLYAAGEKALGLLESGDSEGAQECVKQAKEVEFGALRRIFRSIKRNVSGGFKTMLVITELGERRAAFEVDSVHTVKDCAEGDIESLPDTATGSEFMRGLVHQDDGGYVLICDLEQMYHLACPL